MRKTLARRVELAHPSVDVPEIEQCNGIAGSKRQSLLKVLNCFVCVALLSCHHSQVVPRFRIVRTKLEGLFEIATRLRKIISPKAQSAQVVIAFRVIRLCNDDLLKRLCGRLEITMLEHRDPIGKIIPLGTTVVEVSWEGQRFPQTGRRRCRNRSNILRHPGSVGSTLVEFDDHAVPID